MKQPTKTNHRATCSFASRFTPLLRYVTTRNLAVAMFVALAFLETTRRNDETEQMALAKAKPHDHSVTDQINDGGLLY